MATKKSKTSTKSTSRTKSTNSKTAEKAEVTAVKASTAKGHCLSGFFARKYEGRESITTVFKDHKFYGALLGEVIGTALLGLLLFALVPMGIANIALYIFALIAILIAVYTFSGACLNPIVTVGMMATRRISVVRGIMYIIAEIIGAWIAWLIFSACGAMAGETAYEGVTMAAIAEGGFWPVALIELFGAFLIGYFFSRALEYKRSVFTFAAVAAGGVALAILVGYVASVAYFGLQNNFIFNPAVALMMQIFPQSGADFGEIFGGICQALSIYAILPMIGGVIGFYLSDFNRMISEN